MATKTKPNYKLLAVGGAAAFAPAFQTILGLQHLAHFPVIAAIFGFGAIPAGLVALLFQMQRRADQGEPLGHLPLIVGVLAAAEVTIQLGLVLAEGESLVIALLLAACSMVGVVVVEEELAHVRRSNATAAGRRPLPRARLDKEFRERFPKEAAEHDDLAIMYPSAKAEDIRSKIARDWEAREAAKVKVEATVIEPPTYKSLDALRSGRPDATPDRPALASVASGSAMSVADLAREAIVRGKETDADIAAYVLAKNPDAKPDTITRTVRKVQAGFQREAV